MSKVTPQELKLINRFQTAFNRIHRSMREKLHADDNENFTPLLERMKDKQLISKDEYKFLKQCRSVRNHIVHSNYKVDVYMAIPRQFVVDKLERFAARYEDAPTVYTYFAKKVQSVKASETLYRVMKLIHDTDYTQFPVYDDDNNFVNLLTENLLTRWLSKHTVIIQEMAFADLRHTIEQALTLQASNDHWGFIPRDMTLAEATALFAGKPSIEALIITETGKQTETAIGIVTRSDALDLLDGKVDRPAKNR